MAGKERYNRTVVGRTSMTDGLHESDKGTKGSHTFHPMNKSQEETTKRQHEASVAVEREDDSTSQSSYF